MDMRFIEGTYAARLGQIPQRVPPPPRFIVIEDLYNGHVWEGHEVELGRWALNRYEEIGSVRIPMGYFELLMEGRLMDRTGRTVDFSRGDAQRLFDEHDRISLVFEDCLDMLKDAPGCGVTCVITRP